MKDRKLILLGVLSVLAVLSIAYGSSKAGRGVPPNANPGEALGTEIPLGLAALQRPEKKSHYSDWGRNPFLEKETLVSKVVPLNLEGIAWDKENPKAVINARIVGVGEDIEGRKVVDIAQDRVIVNDGVKNEELRLSGERNGKV